MIDKSHSHSKTTDSVSTESRSENTIRRERRWRLISFVTILLVATSLVLFINGLLAATVLAFVIAYLFAPIVDFLERKGVSRAWSTFIPFAVGGILVGISLTLVLPLVIEQVQTLIERLPQYQSDLSARINSFEKKYSVYFHMGQLNLSEKLSAWLVEKTGAFSVALPSILSQSATVLLLAPFFAFFMLLDGNLLARSLLAYVPNQLFEMTLNLRHQINDQLGGFIRARFLEAAIVGAVVWLGLQMLSFPFATVLAIFAAAMNLIPYVGPIIGAIPAVLIALVSTEASASNAQGITLFLVSCVYLIAQLIDIVFIIPLVVAKIIDMHPVTVVVMIIAGAEIGGILGMLISVPVASAAKLTFNAVYSHVTNFRD
jgi:putative permease